MTSPFSVRVRYVCGDCHFKSPSLPIRIADECTQAFLPVLHPTKKIFEVLLISMTRREAEMQQSRLERLLADRQWEIEKKMDEIATKRLKLLKALKEGSALPQLKAGILTLNRQLEACENDKIRHARLLSGDLGDLRSHLSRLKENGVDSFNSKLLETSILLWPAPWSKKEKIQVLPCPECPGKMKEEVSGL